MVTSVLLALLGCDGKHNDGDIDSNGLSTDSGTNDADSGGNVNPCENTGDFSVTISGDVSVSLWIAGDDGERESTTFDDAYEGNFPFGGIWVTAYTEGLDGEVEYLAEEVIRYPTTDGNPYSFEISASECMEVHVQAVLDRDADRVLDIGEPSGEHPSAIQIEPGGDKSDADVDILTQGIVPSDGDGEGGDGWGWGSGGGGGTVEWIEVSGDILVTTSYSGGEVAALAYTTSGYGPLGGDYAGLPTSNGSGAQIDYSFSAPADYGDIMLMGAWDVDDNWLFDPTDVWGAYISEVDVNGNPLAIGSEDIEGDIQIPLTDAEAPFKVVPYVNVVGTVAMLGGASFDDDLDPGTKMYVAALKYKAAEDTTVEDLEENAYDVAEFEWDDLTGNSSVPFGLSVPANNVIYLWAYTDADADGTLNEQDEAVGASGTDGKNATGESDSTGHSILLSQP
ncbi:MAG: hypothetical protein GY913_12710 [Proteobacteria bacterium]|nr:hypothetical protein [Pseudomonadota bacterium]MCP4917767.1 hypothetical protein [Pseudomonadota bacterium]